MIAYASRALTPTEQKYAQIEKEMLAVVFGCTKFHKMIYGKKDVTVESDHKPLESLLKKPMNASPMRIQRMRLKLQPYTFDLIHTSGKSIGLADCLSRLPLECTPEDEHMEDDLMVCKADTLAYRWHDRIEDATKADEDLQTVRRIIFHGWPANRHDVPPGVAPYYSIRDELGTYNGVVYKGERIVIPKSMRSELLTILHSPHLGIVKTKQRARDMIYWPGMNGQIEEMASKCETCLVNRHKQSKEPMMIHPIPALPWNKVGADLFEFEGLHYLLMVDYYSNYIEISPLLKDMTSRTTIKHMKMNIARYGIMETLISDNGRQFISAEFEQFTEDYGINHITSSPTHQQSNGLAEEGVKQVKELMKKCKQSGKDFSLALLDLRNTPRDDVMGSPMQRLHGRRAQTSLPIADSLLEPTTINPNSVHDKMMDYRRKQKLYYDRGSSPMKPIEHSDAIRVWTPDGWKPAEYIKQHKLPNSHVIRAGDQGRIYRRNRKHLMITGEEQHDMTQTEPFVPPAPTQYQLRPRPRQQPTATNNPQPTTHNPQQPTAPIQQIRPALHDLEPMPRMDGTSTPTRPPQSPIRKEPPTPPPAIRPTRQRKEPGWLKDYVRR